MSDIKWLKKVIDDMYAEDPNQSVQYSIYDARDILFEADALGYRTVAEHKIESNDVEYREAADPEILNLDDATEILHYLDRYDELSTSTVQHAIISYTHGKNYKKVNNDE